MAQVGHRPSREARRPVGCALSRPAPSVALARAAECGPSHRGHETRSFWQGHPCRLACPRIVWKSNVTFHMVLARPEVRSVGATVVISGADPIRWTVKGEAVGRGAIHSILHDHSLVVGQPGRYDLLVLGTRSIPPAVRLEVPDGVVGRCEGVRLLTAAPQPTSSRSGSPDDTIAESVPVSDVAHWHFRFSLTAEAACRSRSDPSWRPYRLKGILNDGRVVTDWFVLQDQ